MRLSFHLTTWTATLIAATIPLAILGVQLTYGETLGSSWSALRSSDVQAAIFLSLASATTASLLALLLAIPSAYALAHSRHRVALLLDALLDIPIVISPIVIGLSLILLFRTASGRWFESHLFHVIFEPAGIVVAQFVLAFSMEVRIIKNAFADVDPRLEQVARTLGCTPWGAFRHVALPMVRTGIVAGLALGWCRALGDFGATVTLAGAISGKTETIPIAIYMNLASVRIDKALALSLVLSIIALVVLVVIRFATHRERS